MLSEVTYLLEKRQADTQRKDGGNGGGGAEGIKKHKKERLTINEPHATTSRTEIADVL